jgi:hypothetical protein
VADTAGQGEAAPDAAPSPGTDAAPPAEVDVELLAEKVYQLMRAEARLSRARGQRPRERRRVLR